MKYRKAIEDSETPSNWGLLFIRRLVCSWSLCMVLAASASGEKHFDFNARCQEAYNEIIQLRIAAGTQLLEAEKKRDPSNLIPLFLDNYIDFFILFFNEDPAEYQARKEMLDRRIQSMSEGPDTSPFYLFTRSVIHFQWAAIKIKFGDSWDAGWEFRRSFVQSKELSQKFPSFMPAQMLSGAMQVVAGTIPDGYKWLSNLLGIKGSIASGMQRLGSILAASDPMSQLFRNEATFYYLYLTFHIENKHEEVFQYIHQHALDLQNNHLFAYLAANLGINNQRSAYAEQVILHRNMAPGYLDMPVWDLEMGYARLNHLQPDARVYLERYLQHFKGKFYIRDALQKLSWSYYLQGDETRAKAARARILSSGGNAADADKQALKDAKKGAWPDRNLLKARLLSDGGYYAEALEVLKGEHSSRFALPEEKCELTYRLARIYDGLSQWDEALGAYRTTITQGRGLKEYYAARAALQAGYICEQRGDKAGAIGFFEQCLSLKEHDYKTSLDQKAKAGIARCKGD